MEYLSSFICRSSSPFAPPPTLFLILFHPISTLFTFFHYLLVSLRGRPYRPPSPSADSLRMPISVTCISDTHSKYPSHLLPTGGELLIHAGDLTNSGTLNSIQESVNWLKSLQKKWPGAREGFRYIVCIAGNHDSWFDPRSRSAHDSRTSTDGGDANAHKKGMRQMDWGKIIYLEHEQITLKFLGDRQLKIYGAPQIPKCGGKEFAFQYERKEDAWTNTIPPDVDVLVTHNPPKWHMDIPGNGGLGDENELKECWRVKPTLHVFGHIHSGHGKEAVWWDTSTKLMEDLRRTAFVTFPGKQRSALAALTYELTCPKLWLTGLQMLFEDVKAVLFVRFMGGISNGGWMINAAMTYQTTETLRNKAQTVWL